MEVVVETAAVGYPVTLAEANEHLNLSSGYDADLLLRLIAAATDQIQAQMGQQFLTATHLQYQDGFYDPSCRDGNVILLQTPPVSSVTSIKYFDETGTEQTWSSSYYDVDCDSQPARILPIEGETYPTTQCDTLHTVWIKYVCGYGVASAVPQVYKLAILQQVTDWYVRRGGMTDQAVNAIPRSINALVYANRIPEF